MGLQIALTWSESQERALLAMGFKRKEVLIKACPQAAQQDNEGVSAAQLRAGRAELLAMPDPPFQFAVTSHSGRMPE